MVLVNWRTPDMTLQAVERALNQSLRPARVYVVDNGSGDGSAERLGQGLSVHGQQVALVAHSRNDGFGAGNNLAMQRILDASEADFIWLLNNDAVPAPDCLQRLVAAASAAPGPVGIVGSLLVDPDDDVPPHFGSWLNPVTLSTGVVSPSSPIDRHPFGWMTAASMLVSVAALRAVGLFDPRFFMYWEDADLNMRIRQAGFLILGAADARVEHHAGTSSAAIPVQRYLWHLASEDRFIHKHHPLPGPARVALRARFLAKAILDRDLPRVRAILRAAFERTDGTH